MLPDVADGHHHRGELPDHGLLTPNSQQGPYLVSEDPTTTNLLEIRARMEEALGAMVAISSLVEDQSTLWLTVANHQLHLAADNLRQGLLLCQAMIDRSVVDVQGKAPATLREIGVGTDSAPERESSVRGAQGKVESLVKEEANENDHQEEEQAEEEERDEVLHQVETGLIEGDDDFDLKLKDGGDEEEYGMLDDFPFACADCGLSFQLGIELKSHMKVHEQYACLGCAEVFFEAGDLKIHEKLQAGTMHFNCTECVDAFDAASDLKTHVKEHLIAYSAEKANRCAECGKRFSTPYNLQRHAIVHTGEKPFTCPICLKTFTVATSLKTHERSHTGERPYACSVCPQAFSRNAYLINHMKTHAAKEHVCNDCGKGFTTQYKLKLHERIHNEVKPHRCSKCGKSFRTAEKLNNHMSVVHTDAKRYICSDCGNAFTTSGHLKSHMRLHTGEKPFSCSTCQKAFTHKSNLKEHMRVHTGEKRFSCYICFKMFAGNSVLKYHLKKMHAERNYSCPTCCRTFWQKARLDSHMKSHSMKKPLNCAECDKAFAKPSLLRRHMTQVHGKKEDRCHQDNNRTVEEAHLSGLSQQPQVKSSRSERKAFGCSECPRSFNQPHKLRRHMQIHAEKDLDKASGLPSSVPVP